MKKFILLDSDSHRIYDAATVHDALDQDARDHGFEDHFDAFHKVGLSGLEAYEVVRVDLPTPPPVPDRHAILAGLIFDMCGKDESYWSNDQIHEMTLMFFDQGGKSDRLDLEVLRNRLGTTRVTALLAIERASNA